MGQGKSTPPGLGMWQGPRDQAVPWKEPYSLHPGSANNEEQILQVGEVSTAPEPVLQVAAGQQGPVQPCQTFSERWIKRLLL